MGSKELGGSPHQPKREIRFSDLSGRQGNFENSGIKPIKDNTPKAATGGGGDKPPTDSHPSNADAEFPEKGPKRDLEGVMQFLVNAQEAGGDMLEAAIEEQGAVTIAPFLTPKESLAEYGEPSTVQGALEFDQGLVETQYHETLNRTGLEFTRDIFSPDLVIVDGQRFNDTLSSIPEGSDLLNKGLENVAEHFFVTIRNAYISPSDEATDPFVHPALKPHITGNKYAFREYNQTTTEMLKHGDTIAEQLERLAVKDTTVTRLKAAHTANQEGMLPEWAVADHWDLYRPPTTNSVDRYWTTFTSDDWRRLHDFLDSAAAKAPKDSTFIRDLTKTMQTNIHKLRSGIVVPAERDRMDYHKTAQEYLRHYDPEITSITQKLQKFTQGEAYGQ